MYGGFLILIAIMLVPLAPIVWVAWWTIADLGGKASGQPTLTSRERELPRAA